MPTFSVRIGADGAGLAALAESLTGSTQGGPRRMVGLAGCPGVGKSTLAVALARLSGSRPAVVPMDGFHLADVELDRQGFRARKGAPESFDGWGYAALLQRLRERPSHPVYAPGFDRALEQPLAGAIAVPAETPLVITEGNYLLVDDPPWVAARAQLDEVWHLFADDRLRASRLVARHIASGKSPAEARSWVCRVDGPNARLVEACASRADLLVDLTGWVAPS